MGLLEVKNEFEKLGIAQDILILEESSATVEDAAHALHIEPERIAKTLTFKTEDRCLLVVMAGTSRIDNVKFRNEFHRKARMLTPEEALEYTGHAVGGICPFGLKQELPVFLDISLKKFTKVYPACGDSHSAIGLTIKELEKLSHFQKWVDVTKEKDH